MGLLNREISEFEIPAILQGLRIRWWLILFATITGVFVMFAQESDLQAEPASVQINKTFEAKDELSSLSIFGIDPSSIAPYPSFDSQLMQLQQEETKSEIASEFPFDVNIALSRSLDKFSLVDTNEGDGKTKFTFLNVSSPSYTITCIAKITTHCETVIETYTELLITQRKQSVVSGIDRLIEISQSAVSNQPDKIALSLKIAGLEATRQFITGDLVLISSNYESFGPTVSTVSAGTYLFGAIFGLFVGLLFAVQLSVIDKKIRGLSKIGRTVARDNILGFIKLNENDSSIQHVGAALAAKSYSNSSQKIRLMPISMETNLSSLQQELLRVVSTLEISVAPSLGKISSLELFSTTEVLTVLVAEMNISTTDELSDAWMAAERAGCDIAGVILLKNGN